MNRGDGRRPPTIFGGKTGFGKATGRGLGIGLGNGSLGFGSLGGIPVKSGLLDGRAELDVNKELLKIQIDADKTYIKVDASIT